MPVPEVSPAQLARALALPADHPDRPALLDVRWPQEHAVAALPGALLIPLPELDERADELAPLEGRKVVVLCHHGVRSLHGAAYLRARGLDAASLAGGIDRWSLEVDPRVPRY